jgi:SAM-dependent methyltransferase
MTRYTYGDSELAGERLVLLARTFEPASRAFLTAAAPRSPALAFDLGCGPGLTTRLVHEVTGAATTVGIDRSEAFVDAATASAPEGVGFLAHDVLTGPPPGSAPDLIFARLLLPHLPEPAAVVAAWCRWLAPGGSLLLDDPEDVVSADATFRTYLDEVAFPVVATQGGNLLLGPVLHAMQDPPGTERTYDEVASFQPPAAVTARIFAMNLRVLGDRGEIAPRPDLLGDLDDVAEGHRLTDGPIWRMRQVAFRVV